MKRAILVFFVITIALIVRGGAYPATAKVTLAPRVEVQPARPVALKDIARIDGPKEAIQKIGAMTIASGPLPGKSTTLESNHVRHRLRAEIEGGVEVRGAARVELVGKCIRFSPQTLADQAKQFVLEQLPHRALVGDIGGASAIADRQANAHRLSLDQYTTQQQSISGVSLDEEMTNMIKFQQAYNAAARMITVMDEMLGVMIEKTGIREVGR